MRRRAEQRGDPPWVAIGAALLGAVGVVLAALVARPSPPPPSPTPEPGEPRPSVVLASVAARQVDPEPSVALTFVGSWQHLSAGDDVFVLVEADVATADAAAPAPSAGVTQARYLVSQPADLSDDGTWSVTWVLGAEPLGATFTAVVVEDTPVTTDSGSPGDPVPGPTAPSTTAPPATAPPATASPSTEATPPTPPPPATLRLDGPEARGVRAADSLDYGSAGSRAGDRGDG